MADSVEKLTVERISREGRAEREETVARELPLTIVLNNRELVTLLCSPSDLDHLAVGFLSSEGLLGSRDDLKKIMVDHQRGVVRVEIAGGDDAGELVFKRLITSGCGRGASLYSATDVKQTKVESKATISAAEIFNLVREFQHRSQVYRTTGGVHSAALCDHKSILVFCEDIGRHNAIDKIFGECLLTDIPTADRTIITSGRISSEILLKVARRNIPILVSKSAPTDLGVRLADDLGVTLIGFVRGERMNIYAHGWRVIAHDGQ